MAGQQTHPYWYRIAALRPRLRMHAQVHRHVYRGRAWYVLEDPASGRFHRFGPEAYAMIGLMDGRLSLGEIWRLAGERHGDTAPTQDDAIRLLAQLHSADLLQTDVTPDIAELLARSSRQRHFQWAQYIRNPLAVRFPLLDPERFLEATIGLVRPLFGWFGGALWLATVATALALVAMHWPDLTNNLSDRILATENLLLLWLLFPIVKAIHEFGHAYAVKAWGGEVHEMGIMLLVLVPIPYVDASAASAFRARHRRVIVGAAGMLSELLLAALAVIVWVNVEPGLLSAAAFNVIMIAGVSTLLFNLNPLMRFDGYFIFSDLIDIPNLAPRSARYVQYLVQRYAFGLDGVGSPATVKSEKPWLAVFAIASFLYRCVIVSSIAIFIAGKFLIVGVLLALWVAATFFLGPFLRAFWFLSTSPALTGRRARAAAISASVAAAVSAGLFLIPVPAWTLAEGVIWIPEDAYIRAGTGGTIESVAVRADQRVQAGETAFLLDDRELRTKIEVLQAQRRELLAQQAAARVRDRVSLRVLGEQLREVEGQLKDARDRKDALTVAVPADGRIILANAESLPGRYVHRGDILAYVVNPEAVIARVVVEPANVDLIRNGGGAISVRLADAPDRSVEAHIVRAVPAASDELPGAALSQQGGGTIAMAPDSTRDDPRSYRRFFHFDLQLAPGQGLDRWGSRVHVRFEHGREPLAAQIYRAVRRVFLRKFNV